MKPTATRGSTAVPEHPTRTPYATIQNAFAHEIAQLNRFTHSPWMTSNAMPWHPPCRGPLSWSLPLPGTGKTSAGRILVSGKPSSAPDVSFTPPRSRRYPTRIIGILRAIYGDQVGPLNGDVSENRDARSFVMTTEVLRQHVAADTVGSR